MRAFKRREVYATTGPMIGVKVFAGAGLAVNAQGSIDDAASTGGNTAMVRDR